MYGSLPLMIYAAATAPAMAAAAAQAETTLGCALCIL
jgi:hypothetical protein